MLSELFFTRVQVAELLGFKSDSSIKMLEKEGLVRPVVKPSRYSSSQVLFMIICKEIVKQSNFNWKDLSNIDFNFNFDIFGQYPRKSMLLLTQIQSITVVPQIEINQAVYENIKNTLKFLYRDCENFPFVLTTKDFTGKNTQRVIVLIDEAHKRLEERCLERGIDLNKKLLA